MTTQIPLIAASCSSGECSENIISSDTLTTFIISHILGSKFPIDIRVLSEMMDRLCGMLILASRKNAASLHLVTLPVEWLRQLVNDLPNILERKSTKLLQYRWIAQTFIHQLRSGKDVGEYYLQSLPLYPQSFDDPSADHIRYRDEQFMRAQKGIRDVFISRL